jgi:hypothetical protein
MYIPHLHSFGVRTQGRNGAVKHSQSIGAFGTSEFYPLVVSSVGAIPMPYRANMQKSYTPERVNRHLWTPRNKKNEDEEKAGGKLEKSRDVLKICKNRPKHVFTLWGSPGIQALSFLSFPHPKPPLVSQHERRECSRGRSPLCCQRQHVQYRQHCE